MERYIVYYQPGHTVNEHGTLEENQVVAKRILDFEDSLKIHFLRLLNEKEKELIFPTITIKGIKG